MVNPFLRHGGFKSHVRPVQADDLCTTDKPVEQGFRDDLVGHRGVPVLRVELRGHHRRSAVFPRRQDIEQQVRAVRVDRCGQEIIQDQQIGDGDLVDEGQAFRVVVVQHRQLGRQVIGSEEPGV